MTGNKQSKKTNQIHQFKPSEKTVAKTEMIEEKNEISICRFELPEAFISIVTRLHPLIFGTNLLRVLVRLIFIV